MKPIKNLFATILFILITIFKTTAQASLASENVIEDTRVTTKTGKKVYAVCRDAINKNQWYYFPNELRLAEETDVKGKIRPKITIMRYQYQDAITKESKDGGVLVASFTYAMEPEAVDQVKDIIKRRKGGDKITLSSIPLNTANIEFLADNEAFLGRTNAKTSSAGATSASQEMVICFDLTVLGSSVMKALASGAGGIPIRANITYNGLTPPCGYKVTGNWKSVYDYFEQNKTKEAKTGFSIWGIGASGSTAKTTQTIKENLQEMKGVKIEEIECLMSSVVGQATTTGSAPSDPSDPAAPASAPSETPIIPSYDGGLKDVITAINAAVFGNNLVDSTKKMEALQSQLATAGNADYKDKIAQMLTSSKFSLDAAYRNSIKNIKRTRSGTINYDYQKQRIITRPSTFGGLLSFKRYFPNGVTDDQLKKQGFLIDVDANEVPYVIIGLPNINPDFDLNSMIIEVSYKKGNGSTISEARRWDAGKGWLTVTGKEVGFIRFNLIGETDKKRIEEPEFNVKMSVISKIPNASFVVEKSTKLTRGDKYIDALELVTQQFTIDGSMLDFAKLTQNPDDLGFAKVELAMGNFKIGKDLRTYFVAGNAAPPNMVYLLAPKTDAPLTSKVTFMTNKGIKVERTNAIVLGDNTFINDWKQ